MLAWSSSTRTSHKPNAFYIASSDFVEKYPTLVAKLNGVIRFGGTLGRDHHEEVAKAQAEATGVEMRPSGVLSTVRNYRVVPLDNDVIKSQQVVADRFARLGLIPKPVNVSDIVWKWTPGWSCDYLAAQFEASADSIGGRFATVRDLVPSPNSRLTNSAIVREDYGPQSIVFRQ